MAKDLDASHIIHGKYCFEVMSKYTKKESIDLLKLFPFLFAQ